MEKILVKGGAKLEGKVRIEGAKNAALPILAATILPTKGQTKLLNVPILADIFNMEKVLNELGLATDFDQDEEILVVESSDHPNSLTPYDLMNKMRASTLVMGPLLARNGEAKVAMPGGCAIGQRPIDLHLKGFEAMGAEIELTEGYIVAKTPNGLKGTEFYMDFPSVGATENIMMAATLAEGTTVLRNVAKEPEIVDLANFLNKMGARVQGAGTNTMTIHGVDELRGTEYPIVSDRIVAGTFLVAAAITQGDVVIENFIAEHNRPLIAKMREMGATIEDYGNDTIRVQGPEFLQAVDVETQPYPGFPTDMQSVVTVAQLLAEGTSIMKETVFENRFMHLNELARMNANYEIDGQSAIIYGGKGLHGAEVMSTDLRAAAALILAGLATEKGITRVGGLDHLDRGYYQFTEKLQNLGANIIRVDDEKPEEVEKQIEALKEN